MTFWIITTAMATLVVAFLARASMRDVAGDVADAADHDLRVYRDQLAELNRDLARGVIAPEDAERAINEISRRILTADAGRASPAPDAPAPGRATLAVLALVLLGGSAALYLQLGQPGYGDLSLADRIAFAEEFRESRPSQQTTLATLPPRPAQEGTNDSLTTLLDRLRETVKARPDDLQGHVFLAQYEARMGNFTAAAMAQQEVLRLKADAVLAEDFADHAELLVMAAEGYISPEAEAGFRAALSKDEEDGRARYYMGLMMVQTGRPDIGFRLWDTLLRRGPPDAPWIAPILSQIETLAQLAGVNYTIPAIGGATPGPSVEDIEAAATMSAEDRMEMIGGMVDGLSNRLATQGGPPQDWARLITSLAIMGNPDQALAVFNNAMEVFAEDPGARDIITAAGSQAGVAE